LDYIRNALVETSISKDIIMLTKIDKPALLRRLFEIACIYSTKLVSLTKVQGNLQESGNITTLANYLQLLNGAGLLTGLEKYSGNLIRKRSSIPKFQVYITMHC
jgi:predicted AAA+ superfamily ATPase